MSCFTFFCDHGNSPFSHKMIHVGPFRQKKAYFPYKKIPQKSTKFVYSYIKQECPMDLMGLGNMFFLPSLRSTFELMFQTSLRATKQSWLVNR